TGLHTGFPALDDLTTGFQPGDFIIIAARPSMGKTAIGLNMAHHAALVERCPVVFFSMEMSSDQLAQRLVSAHAAVEAQKIRLRLLSEEDHFKLQNACHAFEDAPLFIDDTPGLSAMELRSKARRLRQRHGIQAVFVDYLQLMHAPKAESRQVEIATISRSLKSLARELEIPVIAMAQLNRMAEGRQDKRPFMSDLRESGAIEQDADVILLLHREEYYKPDDDEVKGKAELIIAKQRNGPTGTVHLTFEAIYTKFENASFRDDLEFAGEETPF
ncbi:MAG: replicative DNA helicase, partial [Candidatus Marinimicrobia bacterium]|nr:replicative DNA helicase [Candidatus Neomarinimicrobiota bacterium]